MRHVIVTITFEVYDCRECPNIEDDDSGKFYCSELSEDVDPNGIPDNCPLLPEGD